MIIREVRRFFKGSPLLSLSGIVVLALGIGASALVLALLLALSSMTYPGMRSKGYATIAEETGGGGSERITWRRVEELRILSTENVALAAYSKPVDATLRVSGANRIVKLASVSRGFFSVFTPPLSAGRDFHEVEESQISGQTVILSSGLATKLFQSPANALEQVVMLNGTSYEVIGIAPAGFKGLFGDTVEGWIPPHCLLQMLPNISSSQLPDPNIWKQIASFYVVAASDHSSSTRLVSDLSRFLPLRMGIEAPLHISQGLTTDPVRDVKLRRWLRLGLLLALIFTVMSGLNYSLLLLARTPHYAEEVRLKKALGAGPGRLISELMIGPAAMVGAGLLTACLICFGGLTLVSRTQGFYGELVRGSWHAAFLACSMQLIVACALTLVIALIPATGLLRDNGAPRQKYTSTANRHTGFLLQATVTVQIAFCAVSWILAGMIAASVLSLIKVSLGYIPAHLTVVSLGQDNNSSLTVSIDTEDPHKSSFPSGSSIKSVLQQITAIPGVRSVSYANNVPLDNDQMATTKIQRMEGSSTTLRTVDETFVSPDYFQTMGIRIIRGSGFPPGDQAGNLHQIIINAALARELWPAGSPVQGTVRIINPATSGLPSFTQVATVIGVAEDVRHSGLADSPDPTIFWCAFGSNFFNTGPYFVVRGTESIRSMQDAISHQVAALMPGLNVEDVYKISDRVRAALRPEKERAAAALVAALIMAFVAFIGLVGALAYYVGTRRRELAVRICFGASSWDIRKIILLRAALCSMVAVVLSALIWPVLASLISNDYLGRISWSTPRAILISLACILVAILISLIPAAAAVGISPSEILKEQ